MWIGYVGGSACRIQGEQVTRFTTRGGLPGTGNCWVSRDVQGRLGLAGRNTHCFALFRVDAKKAF